ncbi:hypothetical protein ACWGK6_42125 [Streptomyces violaceusniger]|uniref:hypothetical protein n=1 Tax=Streptomyces violaceusniger TaxID=68280 RepID=UPI0038227020
MAVLVYHLILSAGYAAARAQKRANSDDSVYRDRHISPVGMSSRPSLRDTHRFDIEHIDILRSPDPDAVIATRLFIATARPR